jgi:CHAD domain-containing protein
VAFRIKSDESVTHGLRRLAAKNLRAAADELERGAESNDVAIHKARKRVKKVRALAHLVKSDRGRHLRGSRKRLRAVNRSLSALRDADATLEIFDTIRQHYPAVVNEHTFARVRRTLARYQRDAIQAARDDRLFDRTASELRALEKRSKRWRTRHDHFGALARGIRATHRRGRQVMERAVDSGSDADFHAWRTQIKRLWYELRLLGTAGGGVQKDIAGLHAAEQLFGDDHNVTVLCARLNDLAASQPAAEIEALRAAAERYQRELRRKATAKARPIFTMPTKDYADKIKRAWRRWRHAPASDGTRTTAA